MNVVRVFIGTCLRRGYGACTRLPRPLARLYAALVVAVVAGTMLAILAAVRVDIRTDPAGALILMSVCLWIPQQLIVAYCYRRL